MKRIIILIDGTWETEAQNANTNVALLDPQNHTISGSPLIAEADENGISQVVRYHCGVGADQTGWRYWLGGAIGLGLKQIVLDAYQSVGELYEHGDDIIVLGFSRGAYAARALVGMIGASGILKEPTSANNDAAWENYRVKPKAGVHTDIGAVFASTKAMASLKAKGAVHPDNRVKCVGVWETVGSYGVPAGFGGISELGRYIAWADLGFHDTSFGGHVEIGLHALAVDERRRSFVPTFWTIAKGRQPKGYVEQTWFAGDHCGVGGGYTNTGLSNEALIWMIARLQALASVKFDSEAVLALSRRAFVDGEVYDSTIGWPLDHTLPHLRIVLSPDAIDHGALFNKPNSDEEHINERIHWSLVKKRWRPCTVFGKSGVAYDPQNYPASILPEKIANITAEEKAIYGW